MVQIVQQIQKRMLVSLAQIAKVVGIKEGDRVIIEERDGGIFLRPVALVDKSQAYIWTKEWQEQLRESDEALANGEYKSFDNVDDCIRDMEEMIDAHHSKNKTV